MTPSGPLIRVNRPAKIARIKSLAMVERQQHAPFELFLGAGARTLPVMRKAASEDRTRGAHATPKCLVDDGMQQKSGKVMAVSQRLVRSIWRGATTTGVFRIPPRRLVSTIGPLQVRIMDVCDSALGGDARTGRGMPAMTWIARRADLPRVTG